MSGAIASGVSAITNYADGCALNAFKVHTANIMSQNPKEMLAVGKVFVLDAVVRSLGPLLGSTSTPSSIAGLSFVPPVIEYQLGANLLIQAREIALEQTLISEQTALMNFVEKASSFGTEVGAIVSAIAFTALMVKLRRNRKAQETSQQ